MKVHTHVKAGITADEVWNDAKNAVSNAAHTVSDAAQGVAHSAANLVHSNPGLEATLTKLWYWPLSPPQS